MSNNKNKKNNKHQVRSAPPSQPVTQAKKKSPVKDDKTTKEDKTEKVQKVDKKRVEDSSDDSIDSDDVKNIPTDSDSESPEPQRKNNKDNKDTSKNTKDVPKETSKETPKETPKDIPKETTKDIPKDIPKETTKDISKETSKDTLKEVPKETMIEVTNEDVSLRQSNIEAPNDSLALETLRMEPEINVNGLSGTWAIVLTNMISSITSDNSEDLAGKAFGEFWNVVRRYYAMYGGAEDCTIILNKFIQDVNEASQNFTNSMYNFEQRLGAEQIIRNMDAVSIRAELLDNLQRSGGSSYRFKTMFTDKTYGLDIIELVVHQIVKDNELEPFIPTIIRDVTAAIDTFWSSIKDRRVHIRSRLIMQTLQTLIAMVDVPQKLDMPLAEILTQSLREKADKK